MTRSYWLGLGLFGVVAAASSCGDGPVNTATPTGGGPGSNTGNAVGEACEVDANCRDGLICGADGLCEPGHSLGQGEPCVIGPECQDGLQCVAGVCTPAGEGAEGDACVGDGSCT